MKIGKGWLIGLIVGLLIEISTLNIAYAQDLSIWENKWFKLSYKTSGYCQFIDNLNTFPSSDNLIGYLKIGKWNSAEKFLEADLYYYVDGEWTLMVTPLYYMIGNELDFICSSEYIGDPTIGFAARIYGKMASGSINSGTFKTLWGFSYDMEGQEHCVHQLTMSGKLVDESKVPPELK